MTTEENFDYVIVGGGAAGAVVAARLTENPGHRVLLLEAGPADTTPSAKAIPPLGVFQLQRGEFDWCDVTVPQAELNNRRVPISAGRALGGGGAINYMAWFRGARQDFNGWADRGMKGWGWQEVLPRFRRGEDSELGESALHGTGGPIAVTTPRDVNPMNLAFVTAGVEAGLDLNRDFNSGDPDGVGLMYSNIRNGERDSAACGYLTPALGRPNLTVRTGALVKRVLLRGRTAAGVRYTDSAGESREAHAATVVLSAGALRSPQLLMLSGIGPADHLREAGIKVAADLPGVGANLHDHPLASVVWPVVRGVTWNDASTPENVAAYAEHRRGPLASVGQAAAHLRCGDAAEAPDVQVLPMLMDFTGGAGPGFSCLVSLLTPRSRGTVRLRPGDPAAAPVIDPRYLTEPADRLTLLEGLRRVLEIGESPSLRVFIGGSKLPTAGADDATLTAFIQESMTSINHPVGTCRAGTDGDSVVDPQLRVYGIDGLRVIDASVMPAITRGNTHAPSIMIAEYGSDLLLQQA